MEIFDDPVVTHRPSTTVLPAKDNNPLVTLQNIARCMTLRLDSREAKRAEEIRKEVKKRNLAAKMQQRQRTCGEH